MVLNIDVSGLTGLAFPLNSMAMLIALAGAWLLLATRWRHQLATGAAALANARAEAGSNVLPANRRLERFFYGFGFASLGLACLLSWLTRLL